MTHFARPARRQKNRRPVAKKTRARAVLPVLRSALSSGRRHWADGLLRDSTFMIGITVVTSLFGYGFWVVAARTYPAAQIGTATAVIALMSLASIVAEVGLRFHVVQHLPHEERQGRARMFITSTVKIAFTTSLIAALAGLLAGSYLEPVLRPTLKDPVGAIILTVGVIFGTIGAILDSALVALRQSNWSFLRNSAGGLTKLLLIPLAVVVLPTVANSLVLVTVVALGLSVVLSATVLERGTRSAKVTGDTIGSLSTFRQSLKQHLIGLGGFVPAFLLPLEVVSRLGTKDNAYFSLTWAVAAAAFMVSPAVAGALLANVSRGARLVDQVIKASLYTGSILVIPMTVLGIFAPDILAIFGHAYASHGSLLMRTAIVSVIPDGVTNMKTSILRVQRRYAAASALNAAMAIITIVTVWYLLPGSGIGACGIAWLFSQSVGSVWAVWDSLRRGELSRSLLQRRTG